MKFLKKRWVAVLLCVVMVLLAIGIRTSRDRQEEYRPSSESAAENWGEENYSAFTRFILDEAGELSSSSVREISEYNAALDYAHGSICGVAILDGLDGMSMEDRAYELSEELGLGDADALLLVDMDTEDWYFVYGADFSYYVNNELELLFTQYMQKGVQSPDAVLPELFEELTEWYSDYVPAAQGESSTTITGIGGVIVFVLVFVLILVVGLVSSIGRIGGRFYRRGPIFFVGGHHHHPHGPGPRPSPGHYDRNHFGGPSGGRSGGFGGSSRGGGFGHGGGGFGGGSRGGGFGGRR